MTWQYRQAPELYTKPRNSHGVQLHQLATLRNTRHEKSVAGPQVRTTFWSWGTDVDDFLRRIVSVLRFWVRRGFARSIILPHAQVDHKLHRQRIT